MDTDHMYMGSRVVMENENYGGRAAITPGSSEEMTSLRDEHGEEI